MSLQVMETNGHDLESLEQAFVEAHEYRAVPVVILAHTALGRGVRFLENRADGKALDSCEYERAMKELNAHLAELEAW